MGTCHSAPQGNMNTNGVWCPRSGLRLENMKIRLTSAFNPKLLGFWVIMNINKQRWLTMCACSTKSGPQEQTLWAPTNLACAECKYVHRNNCVQVRAESRSSQTASNQLQSALFASTENQLVHLLSLYYHKVAGVAQIHIARSKFPCRVTEKLILKYFLFSNHIMQYAHLILEYFCMNTSNFMPCSASCGGGEFLCTCIVLQCT